MAEQRRVQAAGTQQRPSRTARKLPPRRAAARAGQQPRRNYDGTELIKLLSKPEKERPLCVQVVDATDLECSRTTTLRSIVGKQPLLLAVSKCDLVPTFTGRELSFYHRRAERAFGLRFSSAFAVSATTGMGVAELAAALVEESEGRDVVIAGVAGCGMSQPSSGKSSVAW